MDITPTVTVISADNARELAASRNDWYVSDPERKLQGPFSYATAKKMIKGCLERGLTDCQLLQVTEDYQVD